MSERIIQEADLSTIEDNLLDISRDLERINDDIGRLDERMRNVDDTLDTLKNDLQQFIQYQQLANNLQRAKTDLIEVRQTLERQFGHYELVRRTATGILQADDLGIVRKETISTATEELMLSTPGYWLAPCLVALAAWISDQPELAERALKEGIRRSDTKTSLFFLLVCRRAARKKASIQWLQRYLANQDAAALERTAVIILDAYANGLFGADTEGLVARQMNEWLAYLSERTGFVEQQTRQWSNAIIAKRTPIDTSSYQYVRRYTTLWPVMADILEGASLHEKILKYFSQIFAQPSTSMKLEQQLDGILKSLVTDYDEEELPLRRQEQLDMLIVKFNGDEDRANRNMTLEKSAFESHKDFTQLLTDAAMNSTSSHASPSTQKLAIALSRDWIYNAYTDIVAKNRMKIPHEIPFTIDTFQGTTVDGTNEAELLAKYQGEVDAEKEQALAPHVLTLFDKFCLYGGGVLIVVGLIMAQTGKLGVVVVLAGFGCILKHFSRKKELEKVRADIEEQFAKKVKTGSQMIRAVLAEVVDFRADFSNRDSESQKVLDFLEQIKPEQYVKRLAGAKRTIRV